SCSSKGGSGVMSIALWRGLLLSLAGQTMTHRLQPVQSCGATWIVYFQPLKSAALKSTARKPVGAPSRCSGSNVLARMAACGQTSAHLLHWMQMCGSQSGTEVAMV